MKLAPILKKYLPLLLTPLFLFGKCYRDPIFQGVERLVVIKQDSSRLLSEMTLLMDNPNAYSVAVKEIDCQIFIKDQLLGKCSIASPFVLKKNGTTHATVLADLDAPTLAGLLPELMEADTAVEVALDGSFVVKKGIKLKLHSRTKSRVNFKESFDAIMSSAFQRKAFAIRSLKPASVGFASTELEMLVDISNPINAAYTLDSLDFDLFAPGAESPFGHWALASPVEVLPEGTTGLNARIKVQNLRAMKDLLGMAFKEKVVTLNGTAIVNFLGRRVRVPLSIKVPLT